MSLMLVSSSDEDIRNIIMQCLLFREGNDMIILNEYGNFNMLKSSKFVCSNLNKFPSFQISDFNFPI